jgi:prepilin-type processing-associated H-X9-DG protein
LLELLVVVALLLVLTTLYWGGGFESRQRRQQRACQQNLRSIYMALQIYAKDQADRYPELAGAQTSEEALDLLVPRYTIDTSVFVCPASKARPLPAGESFRNRQISYAYYMGRRAADTAEVLLTDQQIDTSPKAAGQAAFSTTGRPPGNNHGQTGGNLLYGDGHVDFISPRAGSGLAPRPGIVMLNP